MYPRQLLIFSHHLASSGVKVHAPEVEASLAVHNGDCRDRSELVFPEQGEQYGVWVP